MITKIKDNKLVIKSNTLFVITISMLILFALTAFIECKALIADNGIFCYPLDDTFIHLAVAKNVALFGNWGATKFGFESASSSLLWTLLLSAFFRFFSNNILLPFILNVICGATLIVILQQWLKKQNIGTTAQIIILTCVTFFTPLPVLIISGMEHTFQCLISFVFIYKFSDWLGKIREVHIKKQALPGKIYVYGILLTAIRYEGLFLIAIAAILLLRYGKILTAFLFGFVATLPTLIFGIYSIVKGSYFLPNSVLLKANSNTNVFHFISDLLFHRLLGGSPNSLAIQHLLLILPIAYLVFQFKNKLKPNHKFILIIITACSFLHLCFADTGWFCRYEAYLICTSVPVLGVLLNNYKWDVLKMINTKFLIPALTISLILLLPFIYRSGYALKIASTAIENIYNQQYQMGQFMNKYYYKDKLAANDIGCTFYFTEGDNVDLWGLATFDIAKSKRKQYYTANFLNNYTKEKNVKIAIIYDDWFKDKVGMVNNWIKVGSWTIPNNKICGDSIVSFYSVDKSFQEGLKQNLHEYEPSLPLGVTVKYY